MEVDKVGHPDTRELGGSGLTKLIFTEGFEKKKKVGNSCLNVFGHGPAVLICSLFDGCCVPFISVASTYSLTSSSNRPFPFESKIVNFLNTYKSSR